MKSVHQEAVETIADVIEHLGQMRAHIIEAIVLPHDELGSLQAAAKAAKEVGNHIDQFRLGTLEKQIAVLKTRKRRGVR